MRRAGAVAVRVGVVRGLVAVAACVLLGCRPDASTTPEPTATARPTAAEPAAPAGAGARTTERDDEAAPSTEPATEPVVGLPHTCEIELEIIDAAVVRGHGKSEVSGQEAQDAAWAEACAALQRDHGLDCRDGRRVGVASELSKNLQARRGDGRHQQIYEHQVVLGIRKRATGFGDAPGDREEACRRAKAHACDQLVQGPCPSTGVRVIAVDGRPPRPAPARRSTPAPPPTI